MVRPVWPGASTPRLFFSSIAPARHALSLMLVKWDANSVAVVLPLPSLNGVMAAVS